MSKSKLEYIWLDGYTPTANMRSKTKVLSDFSGKIEDCPEWSFDGSSTQHPESSNVQNILFFLNSFFLILSLSIFLSK